jgi:hypothetical protein
MSEKIQEVLTWHCRRRNYSRSFMALPENEFTVGPYMALPENEFTVGPYMAPPEYEFTVGSYMELPEKELQ